MNTLCRIREVSRAVAEFEQRFEREYGLTMNEGVLLCCLDRYGERSSGEIAEALQLTCSNASKVIRSVESRGFINRKLGTDDKRQMYFSLTPQGGPNSAVCIRVPLRCRSCCNGLSKRSDRRTGIGKPRSPFCGRREPNRIVIYVRCVCCAGVPAAPGIGLSACSDTP